MEHAYPGGRFFTTSRGLSQPCRDESATDAEKCNLGTVASRLAWLSWVHRYGRKDYEFSRRERRERRGRNALPGGPVRASAAPTSTGEHIDAVLCALCALCERCRCGWKPWRIAESMPRRPEAAGGAFPRVSAGKERLRHSAVAVGSRGKSAEFNAPLTRSRPRRVRWHPARRPP